LLRGAVRDDTDEAAAAFGIEAPQQQPEETGVYPENWQAVQLFSAMGNQWHSSMGGREGLRYEALPVVEQRLGIKKKHSADVFAALQVMEREALSVWAERRD
jgi:hypothetical protein